MRKLFGVNKDQNKLTLTIPEKPESIDSPESSLDLNLKTSNHNSPEPPHNDLNIIVHELFTPVIQNLLTHPLFIPTIIKELINNPELINKVVDICFSDFEAKYDITPTQIYKDKIQEEENTLAKLNADIEQRSADFTTFKDQILDFQNSSLAAYSDTMKEITNKLLNKMKL